MENDAHYKKMTEGNVYKLIAFLGIVCVTGWVLQK